MSETNRESGAGADVELTFHYHDAMDAAGSLAEISTGWYWWRYGAGGYVAGPFATEAEARADAAENDGEVRS